MFTYFQELNRTRVRSLETTDETLVFVERLSEHEREKELKNLPKMYDVSQCSW